MRVPVRVAIATAIAAVLGVAPASALAAPPAVEPSWVTEVSATSAQVRAQVNPNGLATSGRAEYISEADYQANLAAVPPRDGFTGALATAPADLGAGVVSGELARTILSLKPQTAYRYRVSATNPDGTTVGPVGSFATEETAPVFTLPDNRGWEMVSPVAKNGGQVALPGGLFGGGVLQAAAAGSAVSYGSASFFATPEAASSAGQYLSTRTPAGWTTANVTVPAASGSFGDDPEGVPYQLFSTDLSRALVADPERCPLGGCPRGYLLRATANGALLSSARQPDLAFAGATPDLASVVLSTCAALTADATEVPAPGGCDQASPNLYRWNSSALALINLLPGDLTGSPGATLGAPGAGSVSADGSRVFFEHAGNLYLRQGSQTTQLDASLGGGGRFEAASPSGAVAFFTKAGHLYRQAVGGATVDLTPGGEVEGVLGISADGGVAYYLSASGLMRWANGTTTPVAAAADASNYPPATGTAYLSADGNRLAFLSDQSLTGFDNDGHSEVFLYTASTGTLACVSCNPTGERARGPATLPAARANGSGPAAPRPYKPRALLADGSRLYFETVDSLAPGDSNGDTDVYQWEAQGVGSCTRPAGCVNLISSGRSEEGASFLDASADGSDVFFVTDGSLVPADPGSLDVYDARVGGGFPVAPAPLACIADACQPIPSEPEDPTPGTSNARAQGNPPVKSAKAAKKQKKAKKQRRKAVKQGKRGKSKPRGEKRAGGRR